MTPEWPWTFNSQNYSVYILSAYPWNLNFWLVGLYEQPFSRYNVLDNRKVGNVPMTSKLSRTFSSQRYPVYITSMYLPKRPRFWSVSLYDQPAARYCTFYNPSLNTMLDATTTPSPHPPPTRKRKERTHTKKKYLPKKIWNFTIRLTTLVDTLPGSIHEFSRLNLICTF